MDKIYHSSIQHLENSCSYGMMGIIDTLVTTVLPETLIVINLSTMVRNIYDKNDVADVSISKFNTDMDVLRTYLEKSNITHVLYYLDTDIHSRIPDENSLTFTTLRKSLFDLESAIVTRLGVTHGSPYQLNEDNGLSETIYCFHNSFAYRILGKHISRTYPSTNYILISHCGLDSLLIRKDKSRLLESNTGELLTKDMLGKKYFKQDIRFTPHLLVAFGDKHYLKSVLRKTTKLMDTYGRKFKTASDYEIARLLIDECGVEGKLLSWIDRKF